MFALQSDPAREALARKGPTFDDIDAVHTWLAGIDGCNGRIGVIGFCMGGGFALFSGLS
jgi:carboxymethylenebutenolidase